MSGWVSLLGLVCRVGTSSPLRIISQESEAIFKINTLDFSIKCAPTCIFDVGCVEHKGHLLRLIGGTAHSDGAEMEEKVEGEHGHSNHRLGLEEI